MPVATSSVAALPFLFRLLRRAFDLRGVHGVSGPEKGVEIIVLRHLLPVLQRRTPRRRFTGADRTFLAFAGPLRPRCRWSALLVTPAMLLAWQDKIVQRR